MKNFIKHLLRPNQMIKDIGHKMQLNGVKVNSFSDLSQISPIGPKIWRRLDEYLKDNPTLGGFIDWLELRNERIDILSIMQERGLQDIVKLTNNNKVSLIETSENIRVCRFGISHKSLIV